ncbi:hypothetical protein N5D61_05315 [Pseudomonas sp. GD03842]|uniref:hypothetical protein n=1 Tax=Pseudomonas sp. GD03842 TaxID=2975385 RepID=UPI00244AD84D|nr:hypothetical protein [Pseudomonas sp. GD03842]MDH0745758.1 hypothetical protein [Pseudomonas sp. GD03842]
MKTANTAALPKNFSVVTALVEIASKPGATLGTSLITTRRICRIFGERLERIREESRALSREAGKLRRYLPFTTDRVRELQEQAVQHCVQQREDLRKVLSSFGRSLMLDTEGLYAGLGFDRVCDLLGVNVIEREKARADGVSGIAEIVFVEALEESAVHRGQDWKDTPLFNACHLAFADFLHECPRHLLPDPFAPGAPFGPKLPPVLAVVGGGKPQ